MTSPASTRSPSLAEQILSALRRISQSVESHSQYLWQTYGLTAPQLGALRELEQSESATPTQLAALLSLSPATVAGILKRLEHRGLVSRRRDDDDRRSVTIRITEKGKTLTGQAPPLLRDRFLRELDRMEVWERTQVLSTLQRVAHMMQLDATDSEPFLYHEPPTANAPEGKRRPSPDAIVR